jgi:malate dehydrogenase (oxaloacetate-decarboxylating)
MSDRPSPADAEALRRHALHRGKLQVLPRCPIERLEDYAVWYTPGVAAPCRAIAADPPQAYAYTGKGNSIAIVTDGTRVLGLGDIGPLAGLPVMEGKALLFKHLGGVDAVPICLDTRDADEIVRTVRLLAPAFGAVNLEDIAQPKCFRILEALRHDSPIPVWHDDQQGTAAVVLAGLESALAILGKRLDGVRIALIGAGAANVATARLLLAAGARAGALVVCDSRGTLHPGRRDIAEQAEMQPEKWWLCRATNEGRIAGGIAEALAGADACLAFSRSGPGVIRPDWIRGMAPGAIVFACANPVPEIWPDEARAAGAAIVATGRSDFPNQVNNALVFPGIFRGVLDVQARAISDGMAIAAARALAAAARPRDAGHILPGIEDWRVAADIAAAAAGAANEEGLSRAPLAPAAVRARALAMIAAARDSAAALLHAGLLGPAPG